MTASLGIRALDNGDSLCIDCNANMRGDNVGSNLTRRTRIRQIVPCSGNINDDAYSIDLLMFEVVHSLNTPFYFWFKILRLKELSLTMGTLIIALTYNLTMESFCSVIEL
jgi:hypothetical protein